MLIDITPTSQIDWDTPGARKYSVPFTMDGSWGRVRVPLYVVVAPNPGKTVLAIGGTHGDEYEGPVAFKNLIQEFDPARLSSGRLIVIPVLNVPAFQSAQRQSSLDGINMNRAFPGDSSGSITSRIAHWMTTDVLARADIVIDIHSAGAPMEIFRTMSFHQVHDRDLYLQFKETAMLFGTPFVMLYTSDMGTGLLTEEAEKMGKITIGSELGFGASTDRDGVYWAYEGTLNVMRHHGLINEPVRNLTLSTYGPQRMVSAVNIDNWLTAPCGGISEPLKNVGEFVRKGEPVTRIHNFDRWDEPAATLVADLDGYVLARKFRAETKQGEVVMVIAEEID